MTPRHRRPGLGSTALWCSGPGKIRMTKGDPGCWERVPDSPAAAGGMPAHFYLKSPNFSLLTTNSRFKKTLQMKQNTSAASQGAAHSTSLGAVPDPVRLRGICQGAGTWHQTPELNPRRDSRGRLHRQSSCGCSLHLALGRAWSRSSLHACGFH